MAKQLNVALNFTAETGQAKTAIQDLQASLSKIAYAGTGNIVGNSAQQIKEASEAAKQLQYHLNDAYNATTGNFDLSKLDRSLKASGANIADLSAKLLSAGSTGQQAFAQLAQSISMADQPMFRVNAKLTQMLTTLKNTARWQISSSILHGFMGTIQHAYGYAQDLNESLNNIRIVTGQSVDQMAKFAEQANKSAKALSATTTEYTNASLIYYQQGLSDAEVKERTDVTIKMANVAGVSAQTVSDQMTAVWNNFDDGSKSLEYYADVMTALGAATASSTDEIADGLEKFAAVSETVGLSYEYATAALATVTATTRQSADVVGNAFKTLFARIQGLNLGETLDDGTTLNKYSEALAKVGISIKDQSGQMKEMDDILDEMGAKWDTLDKAQQTALAQTVAGVRQYTQLIALMDNWDYFKENLGVAYGAEGTLNEQAEIYAESWEAARDRVAAAAESIYQNLLDDKFFITINNGFANLLTGVGEFVKGIGGAKGVIAAFGSIFLTNFAHKMPDAIQNLKYNLQILTNDTKKAYTQIQADMENAATKAFSSDFGKGINRNSSIGFTIESSNQLAVARTKLAAITNNMSNSERQLAEMELSLASAQQQEIIALKQKNEERLKSIQLQSEELLNEQSISDNDANIKNIPQLDAAIQEKMGDLSGTRAAIAKAISDGMSEGAAQGKTKFTIDLSSTFLPLKKAMEEIINSGQSFDIIKQSLLSLLDTIPQATRETLKLDSAFQQIEGASNLDEIKKIFSEINFDIELTDKNANELIRIFKTLFKGNSGEEITKQLRTMTSELTKSHTKAEQLKHSLNSFNPTHIVQLPEALTATAAGFGNIAMIISSITSTFKALSNPDLSGWEKFSSVLMGVSTIVSMVLSSIRNYMAVQSFWNGLIDINTGKIIANNIAMIASTDVTNEESLATAAAAARHLLKTAAIDSEQKVMIGGKTVTLAYALAQAIAEKGTYKAAIAYLFETGVIDADTLAKLKNLAVTKLLYAKIFAIIAIVAAAAFVISKLVTTQKEANKAIEEANQKYDEENQKLEELESQLKSIQDRIKELQASGTLSITEQEELDRLLAEEASLERQVELQKILAENALRESADKYSENVEKASGWIEENPQKYAQSEIYKKDFIDEVKKLDPENAQELGYIQSGFDYIDKTDPSNPLLLSAEDYQTRLETLEEFKAEESKLFAEWQRENEESYLELDKGFQNWMSVYGDSASQELINQKIAEMQAIDKAYYGDDYERIFYDKQRNNLISSDKLTGTDTIANILSGDMTAAEVANGFSETFKKQLLANRILPEDYAQHLMDEVSSIKTKFGKTDIISELLEKGYSSEDLLLLAELELTGEESLDEVIAKLESHKRNNIEVTVSGNYKEAYKAIKDLEYGDALSAEDYGKLSDKSKSMFTYDALSEEYKLTGGSGQQLRDTESQAYLKAIQAEREANEERIAELDSKIAALEEFEKSGYDTTSSSQTYIGEDGIEYLDKKGVQAQIDLLKAAGMTEEAKGFETDLYDGSSMTYEQLELLVQKAQEAESILASARQEKDSLLMSDANNELVIAASARNSNELDRMNLSDEATIEGYKLLASQYEECEEALVKYNKAVEEFGEESEQAKESYRDLQKALKKVEWDKFTKEALDYAKALGKATSKQEIQKNLKGIQKAFSESLGFEVSMKALEKYKDKFVEWANAGEEASDDVATQLYSLLQLEENVSKEFADFGDERITLEVGADTYAAESKFSNLADFYDSVKGIVEANPPVVDAQGNADFSNMIAAMLEAGYTAADVAAALQSIGQTQVDFSAWGAGLPNVDFGDIDSIINFINALNSWVGNIEGTTNAPLTAESLKSAFPGGKVPAATGSGGGRHSGGGGSGGGGGSKKPPEKKNDSDKERYHTLINQLEDLQSEYDAISEASDRAFGADKLTNMDKEIAKTDELIDKQKEYLAAIEENLPMDKAIMVEYYNEVIGGPEMEFDEKGNISNYDAIQDAMYKAWNEDYYNLPEEERQAWEEKYEKVEKYIEQYEETYDLLRDEEQVLQDLINQRLDLLLEEVQYEVELKLNVSDDSLQLIEFQLNMLEDNAFKAAEAIEYQTEQAEILYDKMQANEQGLRDILTTSDMSVSEIEQLLAGDTSVLDGHTFTEAQIEAIKEYRDNLLDLSEELQEVREEVQERLLDAFDEWNEELDEGIEKFDHYNSIMENYKNMIEIVGKEYLKIDNKVLGNLDQAMVENNINRVKATKDALDALTDTEIRARQAYEDAVARGNENDIQYWKETLETIGDEVESAEEEMMQAWEDALQAAADAFEAAVESAIENFEKALLPFGTLEEFSDAYEKQQEVADQYLDDYQQIYELSKLNRDIANSMDDTKSIAGKQKLKGLMDDINKLQEEGTQLSEYDLEYLQKTYDLRMAEIALEEAQKAKDTVRLTRDNEGNWSYAYTTNTDAADDAAQKYEDALYAMQELSSEYIDEMSEQLISTSQEMEEALAAVRVEDYASIEEYYKKLDEIQQYYLDRMGYMQGEMQKALDNNKALYEQDWQNYSAATGYKISDDEKFAMSYKDTVLGTLFGSESDIIDFQERVNEALGTSDSGLIGELLDAYLQWSQNTDDAMNAAGTSSEDFAEDMDTAVYGDGGIIDSSTAATEAVNDMATQMVAGFDTISSAVERWQSQAGDAADAVIQDYLDIVEAYNLMVQTLSSTKENESAANSLASISNNRKNSSAYENTTNASGSPKASDTNTSTKKDTSISLSAVGAVGGRIKTMSRMATGGYTGEWGDSPKLALLDEKELVLNEKDTSNFLSAISLTREILNTIDLNAKQASVGLGAMVAGAIKQDILQGLEQSVHITAEFPNVTDHYEVEEALNNLINTSSQYANRK